MYFGKQFHRSNEVQLGEPVRVAVVLKDKCGNVVRDRRWYDKVRVDVHRFIGGANFAAHLSTIRLKFREQVRAC